MNNTKNDTPNRITMQPTYIQRNATFNFNIFFPETESFSWKLHHAFDYKIYQIKWKHMKIDELKE